MSGDWPDTYNIIETYSRARITECSRRGSAIYGSNGWGGRNGSDDDLVWSPKEIILVKCTILMLLPVMSSILSVFQIPVGSEVHAMLQVAPSLKTSPGLGSVGVGSAKASKTADKIKVGRARRENMTNGREG